MPDADGNNSPKEIQVLFTISVVDPLFGRITHANGISVVSTFGDTRMEMSGSSL